MERTCAIIGYPKTIRADHGWSFSDIDLSAYFNGVKLDFSRPGKRTDDAFIEAFDGLFRGECLEHALVPEP
jgi:putative transposase